MSISKKFISTVLVVLCLMGTAMFPTQASPINDTSITAHAAAAKKGTYLVKADALNIRKSPSTSSAVLSKIYNGNRVYVSSVSYVGTDYWGKVYYAGYSGYINLSSSYVTWMSLNDIT